MMKMVHAYEHDKGGDDDFANDGGDSLVAMMLTIVSKLNTVSLFATSYGNHANHTIPTSMLSSLPYLKH